MAGLAKLLNVEPEAIARTLQAYIDASEGRQPDAFGKTVFPVPFSLEDTFCTCSRICWRRATSPPGPTAHAQPSVAWPLAR